MKNYYSILELAHNCSKKDIKRAYKRLANLYHPDKGSESTSIKFQEILKAYEVLFSTFKRKKYDQFIKNKSQKSKKQYNMTLEINIVEAYNGCMKVIKHSINNNSYLVDVPKKVKNGDIIKVNTAECIVNIKIEYINTKDHFIEKDTIISINEVSYLTMITGGNVTLNVLGKKISYKVKECSQNGLILNGIDPDFNNLKLLIKIITKIPDKLNTYEKDLLNIIKKNYNNK